MNESELTNLEGLPQYVRMNTPIMRTGNIDNSTKPMYNSIDKKCIYFSLPLISFF